MKFSIILLTILIASCGKHEAKDAKAAKKPANIKVRTTQALSLTNHSTNPDTFTFFYFPKLSEINWKSSVFDDTSSEEDRLASIVEKVLKLSRKIDDGDEQTYQITLENKKIQTQMVENNCGENEDDDISEDFTFGDGAQFKAAASTLCEELTTKLYENMAKADQLSSVMKSKLIQELQSAIDDVHFIKDENGEVIKTGDFKNWQEYGDANDYVFDLLRKGGPFIYMPTLGKYQNSYSSKENEVYDINLTHSQYDSATAVLKFKVKEKGENGKLTGFILHAELEKMNFAGKVRFSGDILKKNSRGEIVQHGVMKFELAETEDIDTGDDW